MLPIAPRRGARSLLLRIALGALMAAPHSISVSPIALGAPAPMAHGDVARGAGPPALRWIPGALLLALAPFFLSTAHAVAIGGCAALAVVLAAALGWRR